MYLRLLLLILLPSALAAQVKLRNKKEASSITYTMKHTLHEWSGTSKELTALMETDEKGSVLKVAGVVKISTFDSKNSNRDSHMLEVTNALTYPTISFASTGIKSLGEGKYLVNGDISFHGKKKPVEFTVTEETANGLRVFSGSMVVLLEDFNIERPTFMLIKTDNDMKIDLKIVF